MPNNAVSRTGFAYGNRCLILRTSRHSSSRDNGNQDLPHAERSKDLEALRRLFQAWGHCRVEGMWDWSAGKFSLGSFLVARN
jgi:hypothetical protein